MFVTENVGSYTSIFFHQKKGINMPNSPSFDQVLKSTEDAMNKALEFFGTELRGIRSGRATPGLVENIKVDSHGNPTPLKALANIAIPEPRVIVIKPFESSALKSIENAIAKANLGFTLNNDGKLLRINIPPLSQEGRDKLIAQVKDMAEKTKVSVRTIRRDSNKKADQFEKESKLSEDDNKRLQTKIQDLTKTFEEKVSKKFEEKKKEISDF